jgi:signal transduction histidine kinase
MNGLARLGESRRFLLASVVFALFVLSDIALFSWLIFRSLSQREVERVLLETRTEAETLARQIAKQAEKQGKDLFTAVAVERETQTYIDSMLRQRDFVREVEVRDKNGVLVFQSRSRATQPAGPPKVGSLVERPLELAGQGPRVERKTSEQAVTMEIPSIQVPIGELGTLQIGLSAGELSKRIGVLRGDLIRQSMFIGLVSILLLLSAYTAVWLSLRRARRLELQAVEAERLAYIGTLASGLAHEIRNPLNSLNLNMQMLEEEIAEHGSSGLPSGKRLLSITRSEINRLERLATDFLAYAKPRPLDLEEMPAVRPLEQLREVLAGEIQKRLAKVTVEDRSGGARIKVDPHQINQLLLNLAHNAMAAVEEAGRSPILRLSAYRHGPTVALELTDNGVGIPEDEEGKVFDLFYSTRKGGTGLGLAIVQRIATAHGGEVRIKSAVGVGTVVTVELPAVGAAEPLLRAALKPSTTL